MTQGLYSITDSKAQRDIGAISTSTKASTLSIARALDVILQQLELAGRRERTLHEYRKWTENYCAVTGHIYLCEVSVESIYEWLNSMRTLSNSTKNIRLKSFKAILSRCYDNGWLTIKFWKAITIKVDKTVKPAATDKDVSTLLSLLNLSNWFELRDATAILLMYRTGIRLSTLSKLQEQHIDFVNGYLNLPGSIMKNHDYLKLPLDNQLIRLLKTLTEHNSNIRRHRKTRNSFVFITSNGTPVQTSFNNNVIQKRLGNYKEILNLENIHPHALRRGYATNLMKKNAPVPLISKALGHSSIDTTTQYLYLSKEQVAEDLKKYL